LLSGIFYNFIYIKDLFAIHDKGTYFLF